MCNLDLTIFTLRYYYTTSTFLEVISEIWSHTIIKSKKGKMKHTDNKDYKNYGLPPLIVPNIGPTISKKYDHDTYEILKWSKRFEQAY